MKPDDRIRLRHIVDALEHFPTTLTSPGRHGRAWPDLIRASIFLRKGWIAGSSRVEPGNDNRSNMTQEPL
jgi:hypothetical protein